MCYCEAWNPALLSGIGTPATALACPAPTSLTLPPPCRPFLSDLELAEALGAAEGAVATDWEGAFALGGLAEARVHSVKEYGTLCDMAAHADVVGLAAPHQVPSDVARAEGDAVRGVVLDVNKRDGIVDLSLLPPLVARAEAAAAAAAGEEGKAPKKKRAKAAAAAGPAPVAAGEEVECRVELVSRHLGVGAGSVGSPACCFASFT